MTDPYSILGVKREATLDEIKKAYKRLTLLHHPDKNGGSKESEALFGEITSAYELLSDPKRRAEFDSRSERKSGWMPNWFTNVTFGPFSNTSKPPVSANRPPKDINVKLWVDIPDLATGCTKKIKYKQGVFCVACGGTGGKTVICRTCSGLGTRQVETDTAIGRLYLDQECTSCLGTGQKITTKCSVCDGMGETTKDNFITVTIPKGIRQGTVLTIKGSGAQGTDSYGNLLVTIYEKQGEFKRDSLDPMNLHTDHRIKLWELLSEQATIEINTPYGKKTVEIGATERINGKIALADCGFPLLLKDGTIERTGLLFVHLKPLISTEDHIPKEIIDYFKERNI